MLDLTGERWGIVLVKPQYEQRLDEQPSGGATSGVVPRSGLRGILVDLLEELAHEQAVVTDLTPSPILGRSGNTEFLARVLLGRSDSAPDHSRLVEAALDQLGLPD